MYNPEYASMTEADKADMGMAGNDGGFYPGSRQLGRTRVRMDAAPAANKKCTCRLQQQTQSKPSNLVSTCEAPLKRHRQITKQRKCSLVNSAGKSNSGDLDEDEAELNAIISSDKSCRQLFSDKKKATG